MKIASIKIPHTRRYVRQKTSDLVERIIPGKAFPYRDKISAFGHRFTVEASADTAEDAQILEALANEVIRMFDAEDGSPTFNCLVASCTLHKTAENWKEWPVALEIVQTSLGVTQDFDYADFDLADFA